jgi:hypothetical protein
METATVWSLSTEMLPYHRMHGNLIFQRRSKLQTLQQIADHLADRHIHLHIATVLQRGRGTNSMSGIDGQTGLSTIMPTALAGVIEGNREGQTTGMEGVIVIVIVTVTEARTGTGSEIEGAIGID